MAARLKPASARWIKCSMKLLLFLGPLRLLQKRDGRGWAEERISFAPVTGPPWITSSATVKRLLFPLLFFPVFVSLAQDGSRLRQGFERLDADQNGQLSRAEIEAAPQAKVRLRGADTNDNGSLTFREFAVAVVRSMQPPPTPPTAVPQPSEGGELQLGDHTRTVDVNGVQRRYQVHLPESYDPDEATAVVLAFHGGGGNPDTMMAISRLNAKSDEAGFVTVYPYGNGPIPNRSLTFNGGECCGYAMHRGVDDVGFVSALLDDLAEVVNVDAGAVFATGLSNGAIMSYRIAAELSERIAAIAPVGGPLMLESIDPARPVAVMHFHGTADRFAPFEGGFGDNGRGGRGVTDFRSVQDSIESWVEANGCNTKAIAEALPDTADDGMSVTRKTWPDGEEGTEVVLIEIEGGGHTWPGVQPPGAAAMLGPSTKDISANDLMWEFFQKHRR